VCVTGDGGHCQDALCDPGSGTDQSATTSRHLLHRGPLTGASCHTLSAPPGTAQRVYSIEDFSQVRRAPLCLRPGTAQRVYSIEDFAQVALDCLIDTCHVTSSTRHTPVPVYVPVYVRLSVRLSVCVCVSS